MGLIRANKGKIGGHITVTGLPVHSGLAHLGVNAVEAAAEAIAKMKQLQRRHRDDGPHNSAFEEPNYTTIQTCMVHHLNTYWTSFKHVLGIIQTCIEQHSNMYWESFEDVLDIIQTCIGNHSNI